jgi:hypothetical protein
MPSNAEDRFGITMADKAMAVQAESPAGSAVATLALPYYCLPRKHFVG